MRGLYTLMCSPFFSRKSKLRSYKHGRFITGRCHHNHTRNPRGSKSLSRTTDDVHRFEELESVLLDTGKEYRELKIKSVKYFKQYAILKSKALTISMTLKNIKVKASLSQEKMHNRLKKMNIILQI